nr:PREDICTED: phospholipid scramblase 2 [Anolis carolinensis]|eukprot:XP_003230373.2 PREDICTED: phospholipid scramblase 2 [Anolis carolinensis]
MAAPGYPCPQPGHPLASPPYQMSQSQMMPSAPGPGFVFPAASPVAPQITGPPPPPRGYHEHAPAPPPPQQPGPDPHAIIPYVPVGCSIPRGLEHLAQIDHVLINQKPDLVEAFIGFERNNMYEVRNNMGHPVFHCAEQNDWLTRNLCGSLRRFSLRINDPSGCEVMRVIRPMKCSSCWFPCCLQQMEVQCPPGNTIGFVEQTWHAFQPKFSVQNVEKETLLRVVGPTFVFSCGGDVNFEVKTVDESRGIGRISKHWSGLLQEVFTDTDNFGIQFPMDLDVKMKAVLLGACFLIDYIYFEQTGTTGQSHTVVTG